VLIKARMFMQNDDGSNKKDSIHCPLPLRCKTKILSYKKRTSFELFP
jgi:hypothetical protein